MMNDHSLWDLVCANSANYTGIVTGLALGFPQKQSQIFWAKKYWPTHWESQAVAVSGSAPPEFAEHLRYREKKKSQDVNWGPHMVKLLQGWSRSYFAIIVSKTGGSCMKIRDECYGVQSLSPRTSSILSPVVQLGFWPSPTFWPHRSAWNRLDKYLQTWGNAQFWSATCFPELDYETF